MCIRDRALAAVIKAENIEASDEEVEDEFKKLAEQYGMDLEMVKKYIQADQVKDQVVSRKAVAVVVDSAVAVKPEKKAAKKAAKKAEDKTEEAAEGEEKPKKTAKKAAKKAADGEEKTAKKTAKKTVKEEKKEEE